jgi:anti-sigma factor ChrR (cupin superfamily)
LVNSLSMLINADLGERAVSVADAAWVASPMAGVERRMLERDSNEVARATSVVRFAAGSRFPRHEHARGEEFLVGEGMLSDGAIVRPARRSGHTLFVKLRQFHPEDLERVVVDCRSAGWFPAR